MIDVIGRMKVREQILSCTNCDLYSRCSGPVPFSGPTPSKIVIIGEAPGSEEDHYKQPFVGPAGKYLKRELDRFGFELDQIAFANAVCCYPGRTPSSNEVAACRHNYDAQLEVVNAEYTLFLGNVAVNQSRYGRIGELRGQWWRYGDGWASCTYHPAAVLRAMELEGTFRGDLEAFKFFTMGVFDPWDGQVCVVQDCKSYATEWYGREGRCNEHTIKDEVKVEKVGRGKQAQKEKLF